MGGLQVGGGGGAAAAGGEGDQQQEDDEAGVPGDKIYLIKTRSSEMNVAHRFHTFQRDLLIINFKFKVLYASPRPEIHMYQRIQSVHL